MRLLDREELLDLVEMIAGDEFCADIQTHLGHPAIESGSAFQRNDKNVTAFIGHAEGEGCRMGHREPPQEFGNPEQSRCALTPVPAGKSIFMALQSVQI